MPKKEKKKCCVYYKDAQWYINRKDRFTFAAKSGHNLEPHNHNDVGSFIVFAKGKYIIDDIGWERYVADYFGPNRYTHICPASRSHSVPVVEGKEQVEGLSKRGDVTAVDENTFAFDFEKAYDIPSITKLSRRFEIREKEIVIKEHAEGNIENIVYRFVTRIKPVVKDGKVFVDEFCIFCKNKAEISVSSFDFEPRFAGFGGEEKMYKAYTVDFKPETIHETEFVISCQ